MTVCPNCGADCAIAAVDPSTRPIVYEVHVTVTNARVPEFQRACASVGVKAVLLELQRKNADSLFDLMTSSVVRDADFTVAYAQAHRIADELRDVGFEVIRVKVETVPWHPDASQLRENQYFETHFPVRYSEDSDLSDMLVAFADDPEIHASRNVFKKEAGDRVMMVTYRTTADVATFLQRTDALRRRIGNFAGLSVDKVISEFAIYDSKISHDAAWTSNAVN